MGNRRERRQRYGITAFLVPVLVMCILAVTLLFAGKNPVTPRHTQVYILAQNYGQNGDVIIRGGYVFPDDAPETYFAKGLMNYSQERLEEAREIFLLGLKSIDKATDDALPFYLYCYLNNTENELKGVGNIEYVRAAVEAAKKYSPAADDYYHLWQALFSIAIDEERDEIAKELLSDVLDSVEDLSLEARVRYNNCIAMLDYIDGNYAKSIRRLYDVNSMLDGVKLNDFLSDQLLFTGTYIGLFYYEFDEFEEAIDIFKELIKIPVKNKAINANRKSTIYVNMASAYIDIGDPEKCLEICDEMEGLIDDLDPDIKYSIQAADLENRARASILLGDFEEAEKNIKQEEEFLAISENDAFYGSDEFLELAKGELECAKGNYTNAISVLEKVRREGNIEYAGILEDVYERLMEAYKATGNEEKYVELEEKLFAYQDEINDTVRREYIEFSKFYADFGALTKANQSLQAKGRMSVYVIIIMILALVLVIGHGITVNKSSYIDSLTGVKNRKLLHQYAKRYHESGIKEKTSIIMLDIDYFKKYNDTYGHLMGDKALKQVATALKRNVRKKDFLIRYGGEEFLIILENMDFITAKSICERINESVKSEAIPNKSSEVADILTVSLGLCINEKPGTPLETLLSEADKALYEAKNNGRDRVSTVEYK